MIKVLLDQSCFDKNGLVILVEIIDAILQAIGAERVRVRGKVGQLWMYRTWLPSSEPERWNVNAEYALIKKINAGVKCGILKPVDSNTHEQKKYGDIADGVVSIEELNAWGALVKYQFEHAQVTGVCAAGDQNADTKPGQDEQSWKNKAVELTILYLGAWRQAGYAPTVLDASNYCEDRLAVRNWMPSSLLGLRQRKSRTSSKMSCSESVPKKTKNVR